MAKTGAAPKLTADTPMPEDLPWFSLRYGHGGTLAGCHTGVDLPFKMYKEVGKMPENDLVGRREVDFLDPLVRQRRRADAADSGDDADHGTAPAVSRPQGVLRLVITARCYHTHIKNVLPGPEKLSIAECVGCFLVGM